LSKAYSVVLGLSADWMAKEDPAASMPWKATLGRDRRMGRVCREGWVGVRWDWGD
jgi:hypothetical protein